MIKINKRSAPQKLIELKERIIRKGLTPEQEFQGLHWNIILQGI